MLTLKELNYISGSHYACLQLEKLCLFNHFLSKNLYESDRQNYICAGTDYTEQVIMMTFNFRNMY